MNIVIDSKWRTMEENKKSSILNRHIVVEKYDTAMADI
jgi:hypothetical protein